MMHSVKIISLICALTLTLFLCGCSALSKENAAEGKAMQQSEMVNAVSEGAAAETKTETDEKDSSDEKEELVYVNLSTDGSVKEVNVINVVYSEDGNFSDYGDYSEVTGISGTEHLYYSDGVISGESKEDRAVYMGSMSDAVLPWTVKIDYSLNGQKISADDLAGKDGKLCLKIAINKNEGCVSEYFDEYLLSMVMLLDNDVFSYVNVKNASVSGIADKQIVTAYLIPGNEQYIELNADVKDFHMPEIELSAAKPDEYDTQIDDSGIRGEIDKITDIKDDITEENDSSIAVPNLGSISSEVREFSNSADDLCTDADEFSDKIIKIKDGTNRVASSTQVIEDSAAQLYNESIQLEDSLARIADIISVLEEMLQTYRSAIPEEIWSKVQEVLGVVTDFLDSISDITDDAMQLLDGSIELHEATSELNDGIAEVDTTEFTDKIHDAKDRVQNLKELSEKLTKDVDDMKTRMDEKMDQYDDKISNAKSKIDDIYGSIDQEIEKMKGKENPDGTLSFASAKNGRIGKVFFCMKTHAIGE